jgi:hypothetical protein
LIIDTKHPGEHSSFKQSPSSNPHLELKQSGSQIPSPSIFSKPKLEFTVKRAITTISLIEPTFKTHAVFITDAVSQVILVAPGALSTGI